MATCTTTLISIDGVPAQPAGPPQGRLTLVTGTPVMTSDQSGKTTIYYTPYNGALVPIYDGTNLLATPFSELTNITTNSSTGNAGPAAVTSNSNYDLFVWNDSGTIRLTRGAAWNSDTARSASTENDLTRVNGILLNLNAITNGPAASRGTYVGTVRSDGSSQINFIFGGISANGTASVLGVWNAYNRVDVRGFIGDSTDSWTYTSGTARAANNSNTMRVSFVQGLQEDFFEAAYDAGASSPAGTSFVGVGYNATNAYSGKKGVHVSPGNTAAGELSANHRVQQLGWGFMSANENADSVNVSTFYGDNGNALQYQTGLSYCGRF